MDRKPIIIANWKMKLSHKESIEALTAIKNHLKDVLVKADVVVCPSFPSLPELAELISKSEKIQLGAQGVHWQETAAATSSVSAASIKSFVDYCIVGHSEQRALWNLEEGQVRAMADLLYKNSMAPIICLGETAEEKAAGQTIEKVTSQVQVLLADLSKAHLAKTAIAYEPIWAISSNNPAQEPDPDEIAGIMLLIRKLAAEQFGAESAERLRIIYGGSIDDNNVLDFVSEPGVDGVLVGSASLKPREFVSIIEKVQDAS